MAIGSAVLTRALQKVGSWHNINIGSESFNAFGDGSIFYTAFSGEGIVFTRNEVSISEIWGVRPDADAVGIFSMATPLPQGSKMKITFRGNEYEDQAEPVIPTFSGNDLVQIISLKKLVI